MKIKNYFTTIIILFISINIFNSCTNEFDYGKSQNAVKTLESSNVLQTTADISGIVITDNGSSLSERGICYSTSNYPVISGLKKADDGRTLGTFICSLPNLAPSTIYYARAYATNSFGTAYGNEITFTTQAATIPILSATTEANLVTATSANTGGTITNSGASNVTSRGVCYSNTTAVPTISNTRTFNGTGIGSFTSLLVGLTPNTAYYIRAYATNGIGTAYGDVKLFRTTAATAPSEIKTTTLSYITQTTASSGGTITSDGGSTISSRGVCWSNTTGAPTIANSKTIDGSGVGAFSSSITSLIPGNTYYLRAYATNSIGTTYGNVIVFSTIAASLPLGLSTSNISSITQTSAIGGGNIITDGGATITSRGLCWSNTTSSPTILNSSTNNGSGIGLFSSSITGLTANTTYYVRSYATNSVGTAYGTTVNFRTTSATIPTGINTTSVSSISQNSAISGGNISSDGGAIITSKGICWSNSTSTPTVNNSTTNNGSGTSSYTSSLTGLSPNTTYYARAYATNSAGTAYGGLISFTTSSNLVVGQSYQGGIIAYIYNSGDSGYVAGQIHGIIAAPSNQSTGAQWGCSGTTISGTNTSFGTGAANTNYIVNSCTTSGIAARVCSDLISSGYSDWYLPSYYELEKLYTNRVLIGGFSSTNYWSSSQASATNAYGISFVNGGTANNTKSTLSYVRAIRKF